MLEQLPPPLSHRRHCHEYVTGPEPVHVPLVAVSVCPSVVVPAIVGGVLLTGLAEVVACDRPATARTVTAPAATSARTFVFFDMRSLPWESGYPVLSRKLRGRTQGGVRST